MKTRILIIATAMLLSSGAVVNAQIADMGLEYWETAEKYKAQGDAKNSFKYYKKSAKEGNARGMWSLGCCYKEGYGTSKNAKEGYKWRKKAVDTNYKDEFLKSNSAADSVAIDRECRNTQEQIHYYRLAMETGDAWAFSNMAWLYYDGDGVKQDYNEAARLYAEAVEDKFRSDEVCSWVYAENRGIFHYTSWGFRQASNFLKSYPDAMYAYEYAKWRKYQTSADPFIESFNIGNPRAVAMVKKVANEGIGDAKKSSKKTLAMLMWTGEKPNIVPQDKAAAVEHWKDLTDDEEAVEMLIIAHGEGVYKADIPEKLYSKAKCSERMTTAANNGNLDAMLALAERLNSNESKAKWLEKAAEKGHKPAGQKLRQLASKWGDDVKWVYIDYAEKNNLYDSLYYQMLWKTQKGEKMLKVAKAMEAGVNVGLSENAVCEALSKECNSADDEYFPYQLRAAQSGDRYSCLRMAGLYDKAKQYEKAIEWYNKIKEKNGSDWFKLYTNYKLIGKETEAASALRASASEGYTEARVILGIEAPKPQTKTVYVTPEDKSCPKCNGNGDIACHNCNGTGVDYDKTCDDCHGRGRKRCWTCNGTGRRQ